MAHRATFRPGRVHPYVRGVELLGPLLGRSTSASQLTEASILQTVIRRTGLEDFGDEGFREPLRVLLQAYRDETGLMLVGRMLAREHVLWSLGQRLEIVKLVTARPEILETPVERPVFITGLPRTGTTLLFRLLALDPSRRWLRLRDLVSCVPWPDRRGRDRRLAMARKLARLIDRVVPELAIVHPIDTRSPVEDFELTCRSFISPAYLLQSDLPAYQAWLDRQPIGVRADAFRFHKLQLQILQKSSSDHTWLLKSPTHLGQLDALFDVYPDARIVITHRDPADVVPSACSLLAILRGRTGRRVDPVALGAWVTELLVRSHERARQVRRRCDPSQICDVAYSDLVTSPLDTLRTVSRHLGETMSAADEDRARAWLADSQRRGRPRHRYSLGMFGLDAEALGGRLASP